MTTLASLPSPCYLLDESALQRNLRVLKDIQQRSGCRILLALKAFSAWRLFPLLRDALCGCCASGVYEARLAREEFGGEVHAFSPALDAASVRALAGLCDVISFNSLAQLELGRRAVADRRPDTRRRPRFGLRINPECSVVSVPLYDPCAPRSRLGVRRAVLADGDLEDVSGFLFHTMCEQNVDALARTLDAVERAFGDWLGRLEWVNFGGGQHLTRPGYEIDRLCDLVSRFRVAHGVEVYLEPGEAVVLNAGSLIASVRDIVHNGGPIAVLDVSCTAHMPDVLEMPYRPRVYRAQTPLPGPAAGPQDDVGAEPGAKPFPFRLAGSSCLAGDVIGDYAFDRPLSIGDRLVFEDMAHYTLVKSTMFNGVPHPSLAIRRAGAAAVDLIREFTYADFKSRLS